MCFYEEPSVVIEKLIRVNTNLRLNYFKKSTIQVIFTIFVILKENDVKILSFQKDTEAIFSKRDYSIKEICKKYDVEVIERVSHTIYDPDEIWNLNKGSPPNTYEQLKKLCLEIGDPPEPIPAPDLKFFSAHFLTTNDIYDENLHKIQDLDYFNIKSECKEQEVVLFKGGETMVNKNFKKNF